MTISRPCNHDRVTRDYFAELVGVVRYVPGNAYCLDCCEPIPVVIEESVNAEDK